MKPFLRLAWLAAMLLLASAAHAAKSLSDTRKARVQVVLKSGETFEGTFKLPDGWSEKPVKIVPDEGKSRKFAPDRIAALIVWEKKHPDKQYVMQRVTRPYYNRKGVFKRDLTQWMVVKAAGKHLIVYMGGTSYEFHRRQGTLVSVTPQYTSFPHVAMKVGAERGVFIGSPKEWIELLADDPTICRRLEEGELRWNDFQTIADTYEPLR